MNREELPTFYFVNRLKDINCQKCFIFCTRIEGNSETKLKKIFVKECKRGTISVSDEHENIYKCYGNEWIYPLLNEIIKLCYEIILQNIDVIEVEGQWLIEKDLKLVSTSGTKLKFIQNSIEIKGPSKIIMERIYIDSDFRENVKFIVHKDSIFSFLKGSINHGAKNNLTISACYKASIKIKESKLIYGNDNISGTTTTFIKTIEGSEIKLEKCTFYSREHSVNCKTTCEFSGKFIMRGCTFENNSHSNKPKLIFSFLQESNGSTCIEDTYFKRLVSLHFKMNCRAKIKNCHFEINDFNENSNNSIFIQGDENSHVELENTNFNIAICVPFFSKGLLCFEDYSKLFMTECNMNGKICNKHLSCDYGIITLMDYAQCHIKRSKLYNMSKRSYICQNDTIRIHQNSLLMVENSIFEKEYSFNGKHIHSYGRRIISNNNTFNEKDNWDENDIYFHNYTDTVMIEDDTIISEDATI